jgi:hypothetical protein
MKDFEFCSDLRHLKMLVGMLRRKSPWPKTTYSRNQCVERATIIKSILEIDPRPELKKIINAISIDTR